MSAPDYDRLMAAMSGAPLEPESPPAPAPTDTDDPNRLAIMLDAVSARALSKLGEILALPLDPSNGNSMRAQSAAINAALQTQARVDELKLRQRTAADFMPRLIQMMQEERAKMKLLVEEINLTGDGALK
jgi:hypothetical protein